MKEKKKFSVIDRLNSFKYAINGLKLFVLQEHNARIHVLAAIVVVLCGIFFKFDSIKWIAVFMVIAIVFIAELLNTAIEYLCDFVMPEYSQSVKKIKDLAAAAVLVSAILAVAVGIILLLT